MDLYLVYAVLLGLMLGSFLNVCIYRLPLGLSIIHPRSACTHCGKILSPLSLIPVISYLFLLGKCKDCSKRISIRYPFVELLTASITVMCYLKYIKYGDISSGLSFAFYFMVLLVIAYIDYDTKYILDVVTFPAIIISLLWSLFGHYPVEALSPLSGLWFSIKGMLVGAGLLTAVQCAGALIYRMNPLDVMGLGDTKLAALMGAFLGTKFVLYALFIGVMLGGVISLLLLITGIKGRKDHIPFGPFLCIGGAISPFYAIQIHEWFNIHTNVGILFPIH